MARLIGKHTSTAPRPRRGEPPRVAPRHARRSAFGRHRAIWSVAAATVVAGLGAFLISTGLQTRAASAESERTDGPASTPFAYVSPPPATPAVIARTGRPVSAVATAPVDASALAADGIPAVALAAYQRAAAHEHQADAACALSWPLLAAIGRVESDHGRFGAAVTHIDGSITPAIIGIPLDGHGTALVLDTDHGRVDGDPVFDRAVGPMQFIPSTWAIYGIDGNGDGRADPNNIFDAARTAAGYLCGAGGDLSSLAGQTQAVLTYNDSSPYLALVLKVEALYARGVPGLVVPSLAPGANPVHRRTAVPPADPGGGLGVSGPAASATPTAGSPSTTAAPPPSSSGTTPTSTPADTATPTPTATPSPTPTAAQSPPTGSPSCTTAPPATDTPSAEVSAPGC